MMQSKIRAALEGHIYVFAKTQGLPVAWEGVDFESETDQSYLRVFVMPATSDSTDLAGNHRLYRGVLQVDIVMPSGKGMGDIEQLAGQIIAHCPKDRRLLTANGFVQLISVMSMGPKLISGGVTALPLTSFYRMDIILPSN